MSSPAPDDLLRTCEQFSQPVAVMVPFVPARGKRAAFLFRSQAHEQEIYYARGVVK
jgi:hypothetical protein